MKKQLATVALCAVLSLGAGYGGGVMGSHSVTGPRGAAGSAGSGGPQGPQGVAGPTQPDPTRCAGGDAACREEQAREAVTQQFLGGQP